MSNFLNANLFYLVILALIFLILVWNIFLQWQNLKIKKKLKTFFGGNKKAKNLEKALFELIKKLDENQKDIANLKKFDGYLEEMALSSIQKIGVVRYNPFSGAGGNQSFTVVLLDSNNNGIIITSLYAQDGNRVYAKPIKNGASEYPLSREEKETIEKAKSSK